MNFLTSHSEAIGSTCRTYNVKSLHVFGSILTPSFTNKSDIDFAVEFFHDGFAGSFDQFFGFKEALEKLLNRTIDLVPINCVKNPVLLKNINSNKQCVYAA